MGETAVQCRRWCIEDSLNLVLDAAQRVVGLEIIAFTGQTVDGGLQLVEGVDKGLHRLGDRAGIAADLELNIAAGFREEIERDTADGIADGVTRTADAIKTIDQQLGIQLGRVVDVAQPQVPFQVATD